MLSVTNNTATQQGIMLDPRCSMNSDTGPLVVMEMVIIEAHMKMFSDAQGGAHAGPLVIMEMVIIEAHM